MKKVKLPNIYYLLHLIWEICKGQLIWNGLIAFLTSIESFIFNVIFIRIIVDVLANNGSLNDIIWICVVVLFSRMGIGLLKSVYNKRYSLLFDVEINEKIKKKLFTKLCSLNVEYCEGAEFQGRYYKMMEKIENTVHMVVDNFFLLIGHLLSMIFVLMYVISVDPALVILMIIPMISGKAMKISAQKRYSCDMEALEAKRKQDYINRVIYLKEYAMELRMTNIFELLKVYYMEASSEIRRTINQYGFSLAGLRIVSDFIVTTASLFLSYLYMGWKFFYIKNVQVSDFAVIINAINNMNGKATLILRNIYTLQENSLYVQQLRDFLEYNASEGEKEGNKCQRRIEFKQIDVNNVCYRYVSGTQNAINDLCFSIKAKEKIAVVGPNGSGKSTFIKVLMALYSPKSGNITIDGMNIQTVGTENYKNLFCPVFQDFKAYAVSIKNNILRGENADDDVLLRGLEAVGLKTGIMGLDNKLDTVLTKETSEEGVVLSGGQLQRLMVARAFVTAAPIIILDEPTAALDAETERNIYDNIHRLLPDKTVIFVTHRLTGTIKADKILMLEEGNGVECGTHKELMELKGRYYKMFNTQAKAYLSDGGMQ